MTVYRAASADSLCIAPLDELTVVYHRPAGATHLLAEPAPEILAVLQQGEATVAILFERLAAQYELDANARDGIAARLEELVEAGLVERA